MSAISDRIQNALKGEPTRNLSSHIGAPEDRLEQALRVAVPTLVEALSNNAQRPQGAKSILEALRKGHDGSVMDDMDPVVRGVHKEDGEGILRHVLGNNRTRVEEGIGQFAGLDPKMIGQLLIVLAPMIMGVLGKMQKNNEVSGEGDLRKILKRDGQQSQKQNGGLSDILRKVLKGSGPGQSKGPGGCMSMLGPLLRGAGGGR